MGKLNFSIDKERFSKLVKKYKPTFKLAGIKKDGKELMFLTEDFLKFILASGLALIMPDSHSIYGFQKNQAEILKEFGFWKLNKSDYNLRKQKMITRNKFRLTRKGFNHSLFALVHKLFIKIPKVWDGKWRIVIFDLPINYAGNRNFLRYRLIDLGFIQIQKSVWAFPFPCRQEINFLIELMQIDSHTHFLVSEMDHDEKFIRCFKKIFPQQFKNF